MSEAERQLLQLLKERSLQTDGTFRLASGDTSNYYIDGKMAEVCSQGAYLIGEVLYERTQGLDIDAIGGLEVGAVPLTTAAVISYYHRGREMEGFWVRDEAKRHGTERLIEGKLRPKSRVVIVDDVVTKGNSVIKALKAVESIGCEVVLVLTLVDRLAGAKELFREHGIVNYQSVFTIQELGVLTDVSEPTKSTSG